MSGYIDGVLKYVDGVHGEFARFNKRCKYQTPMTQQVDTESPLLTGSQIRVYITLLGYMVWLVATGRPDLAYSHSRHSQHMAKPNESALAGVMYSMHYLRQHRDWCLSVPLYDPDFNVEVSHVVSGVESYIPTFGWRFFSDSDHAGNSEVQNKRRSQNGFVAMRAGAPIVWFSKVSSIAFAMSSIGESHADMSSGANEIYAAANATQEALALSYVVEEQGDKFPIPFILEVDNTTCKAFADNTVQRSKLKYIDCRQWWVQLLRDKNIVKTQHVSTHDNLADFFTKILTVGIFTQLRDQMMVEKKLN